MIKLVMMIAFLQYEVPTGMTKQCVYSSPNGTYTITIKAYQLCPLTIQR